MRHPRIRRIATPPRQCDHYTALDANRHRLDAVAILAGSPALGALGGCYAETGR